MVRPKRHARLKKVYVITALRLYRVRIRLDHWRQHHGLKLAMIVLLAAMLSSVFAMPLLQRVAGGYFSGGESLATLRTLLGGTGAALIGAAAIAFSLVVFAMQINVERMPHGLFRRLSSDRKLLGSFLGSFLTAVVVAATSLIPDGGWAIPAIVTALWGIATIVLLFLYAYQRALQLINPIEQLSIMSKAARRDLHRWNRWADKAAILLSEEPQPGAVDNGTDLHFNAPKAHFFQVNSHWTKVAGQAIHYAISYAKRFAEQGDYEVTEHAFERIMLINATYCAAKHGTFVGSNPFFEMPGTTDGFINMSLEQLRQTMQLALAKGDERLAESTLRAIGRLYGVYLKIEYPGRDRSKYHALLAAGYMGSAVESVVPHNMPDLMMEGIRLMGCASRLALDHTSPTEIISAVQKIAALSYVGVLRTDHQPVTLTAFEQLAEVTYDLIAKGKRDIRFPVRQLRLAVTEAAKRFLATPDTPLGSIHRNTLGPYFSSTSASSLRGRFTSLVNQLLEAPVDNTRAGEIIGSFEKWADQIYESQKELLLLAVQKRSSFSYDSITWTIGISEQLNALSNAPACPQYLKDKLRKHAIWLVSTLSWLPEDKESVTFAANYSLTENLFEAASGGYQRECRGFYETCKRLLLGWARKGGRHETGWGILETAVNGLVALAIGEGTQAAATVLKTEFREMLNSEGAPPPELRARAATRLARSVDEFRHADATHSRIDHVLAQLDQAAVRALMREMAEILASDPPAQL
ncbi:hypothetical protein AZ16_1187 [Bordetella bronchiseptica B18-5 (C3)]|nr:hypothetical protein AZ16_1187 [Bordetella bronchiseptica B18-5 (C3)]KDB65299.1 hypothetical protein AZ15_1253 [Bordetella bronchiseptica A1-7]KDB67893.1 hypothetical protein AZ21_1178 [Bordetella bronchiseptica B20-10725633]KDC35200.1 hypothetical protein L508_1234 [Bordetella bronchiseptica M435/02/3]KDD93120.1 hypothetical protein L524_1060 [Bordetella bronchiseptica MBORD762]SUW10200.1 Uncharacterised protein [Bordetella bronchiseptica]